MRSHRGGGNAVAPVRVDRVPVSRGNGSGHRLHEGIPWSSVLGVAAIEALPRWRKPDYSLRMLAARCAPERLRFGMLEIEPSR